VNSDNVCKLFLYSMLPPQASHDLLVIADRTTRWDHHHIPSSKSCRRYTSYWVPFYQ